MTNLEPKPARWRQSARRTTQSDGGKSIPSLVVSPEILKSCGLALRRMGDATRSVAVTSTTRREGRTTIAIGLAAAAAALGNKTILIDLDVLHRDIKDVIRLDDRPGLTDYLEGRASADDCLQAAGRRLEVVTAGRSADISVGDRLDQLEHLLKDLRGQCDLLVADLPQLEAGVLAAHMADLFDSVALVVRAGGVTMPSLEQSVSVLSQRPHVIMNQIGNRPLWKQFLERRS